MLARGMAVIADGAGALFEQARARTALSLYMLPDDPRAMVEIAQEGAEIARRAGERGIELTNLLNIAETTLNLGLWDATREAIAELRQRELGPWHLEWLSWLEAILAAMSGDPETSAGLLAVDASVRSQPRLPDNAPHVARLHGARQRRRRCRLRARSRSSRARPHGHQQLGGDGHRWTRGAVAR